VSLNVLPLTRLLLFACIAMLVAGARPAAAGSTTAIILTSGDAARAAHVKKAARAWLEARGVRVVDGGLPAKEAAKLADCLAADPARCANAVALTGAGRLWLFRIEPARREQATDVNIVLSVFAANGQALAADERYCGRCRPETLTAQVEKVLDVVSQAALARTSARTVIRIRTEPSGALITIDGERVGTAAPEVEYSVNPGEHKITASLADHQLTIRRVNLSDGEEKALVLRLEASAEDASTVPPTTRGRQRSIWPYIVGGVGVGTAALGITLLVLHDPGERDDAERYRKRDVAVPGAILTTCGAVAIGVAAYLFVRSASGEDARVAPMASVSGREVTLGVQGRF